MSNLTARPTVTIVVPSFNEVPEVVAASLASLRAQTVTDFECIVVDESTDESRARACRECCDADPRFRYIHPTQRLGLARSLNLGLEQAKGRFIARFDSDDVCMPDRLALQTAFLESHPDVDVVGGALEIIDEAGNPVALRPYPAEHREIARRMQLTNAMAHPTVMYRRSTVQRHGGYNPQYRYSEDLELWLRWLNAGVVFANLPQVLVRYRQQLTRRVGPHWRYNLRARLRNFSSAFFLRRVLGIGSIALWSVFSPALQERAFRMLMFRRHPPGSSS